MIQNPLNILTVIGPMFPELAKGVQNKPFLLLKVQDAARLLRDVTVSLSNEQENGK